MPVDFVLAPLRQHVPRFRCLHRPRSTRNRISTAVTCSVSASTEVYKKIGLQWERTTVFFRVFSVARQGIHAEFHAFAGGYQGQFGSCRAFSVTQAVFSQLVLSSRSTVAQNRQCRTHEQIITVITITTTTTTATITTTTTTATITTTTTTTATATTATTNIINGTTFRAGTRYRERIVLPRMPWQGFTNPAVTDRHLFLKTRSSSTGPRASHEPLSHARALSAGTPTRWRPLRVSQYLPRCLVLGLCTTLVPMHRHFLSLRLPCVVIPLSSND